MRTASAPATALSGKNISDVSLAISTAIFAAPYAVLQAKRTLFDDPGSLGTTSGGSQDEEQIEDAIEVDEVALSVPGFLALGCFRTTSFLMYPTGDVGVGGELFTGVAGDEDFTRGRRVVDASTAG